MIGQVISFQIVYQFSWNGALQWLIIIVVLSILGVLCQPYARRASACGKAWRTNDLNTGWNVVAHERETFNRLIIESPAAREAFKRVVEDRLEEQEAAS